MSITFTDPANLDKQELEHGQTLAPRFSAEGLITAIAQEAGTGDVLMLANMNADALRLTIETGEAHYYSRSRHAIWKKGETSGEIQKVKSIRLDCDQDAVLMIVEQQGRGAACHTGRKSCFYREVMFDGGEASLADLGDAPLFDPAEIYHKS